MIRMLKTIFLFLIVVVLLLVLCLWLYLDFSLPETKNTLVIDGLDAEVNVIRDDNSVPRIFASTDRDAFFTMGYLHAQDRLWQLELQRRTGSGRLSEIFGERMLDDDKFVRTIGFYQSAADSWQYLGKEAQASLTAYAEGVNQWLKEEHTLPPEFFILGIKPEPWTVEDSLVWLKMMSFEVSRNYRFEKIRQQLLERFDNDRIQIFMQTETDQELFYKSSTFASHSKSKALTPSFSVADIPLFSGRFNGSNAWAIAGKHTESGLPILANDPHLPPQNPSPWYLAEIKGDRIHVTGGTLVGLPIVISGRNEDAAWGITASETDVQDLYLEKTNDHNQYEYKGVWKDMKIEQQSITVKGREQPELLTIRSTHRGPLLSDVDTELSTPTSMRWQTLDTRDTSYDSHFRLNYAQNWNQFRDILRDYTGIPLKLLYADRHGTIAARFAGIIPIREKGDGAAPVPGWNSDYEWKGWVPFEEMPEEVNPESGFLVSANDYIPEENTPHFIAADWGMPYRARRIKELITSQLKEGRAFTVADMQSIQGDTIDILSRKLLPYLLQLTPKDERQNQAIDYLKKWNGNSTSESVATSIYTAWTYKLVTRILADEFGDLSPDNVIWFHAVFITNLMSTQDYSWCDNTQTSTVENCQDMMSLALDDVLDELTEFIGKDMSSWQWKHLHKIQYDHTPFSYVPLLNYFFHKEIATDGSYYTVNVGYPSVSRNYKNIWAPSYRQIIDLGQSSDNLFITSPGQSGNPMSEHFDDLMKPYKDMNYLNMSFGRDNAPGITQRLVLTAP